MKKKRIYRTCILISHASKCMKWDTLSDSMNLLANKLQTCLFVAFSLFDVFVQTFCFVFVFVILFPLAYKLFFYYKNIALKVCSFIWNLLFSTFSILLYFSKLRIANICILCMNAYGAWQALEKTKTIIILFYSYWLF